MIIAKFIYSNYNDWIAGKRHILSEKKDRPSILRLEIFDNLPVNCSWVIDAGLGERVYVNSLAYAFEPNERFTNYSKKSSPYDDALNMSIYDGDQVNESKRLFKWVDIVKVENHKNKGYLNDLSISYFFRLGDEKLENVISTGSNLTISVNFKKSDIYDNQVIGMRISYSYDHKP